jgi:hypothetical protein
MADPRKGRVFTQEEVNTILSRAVERQNPSAGGLTYAELIDTARQAGIDPGAIDVAVNDLESGQETRAEDDQVNAELARRRWRSWRRFSLHFTVYVMFSIFIAAMNIHEGGEQFYPFPILAWGIFVAVHFMAVFFPTVFPSPDRGEGIRRELRKRDEKNRRRVERERRSLGNEELKESAKELGVAVQRGMATVLSDVAKTIHEEVDRVSRAAAQPAVRVATKTRVGDDREREHDDDDETGGSDERHEKGATRRR